MVENMDKLSISTAFKLFESLLTLEEARTGFKFAIDADGMLTVDTGIEGFESVILTSLDFPDTYTNLVWDILKARVQTHVDAERITASNGFLLAIRDTTINKLILSKESFLPTPMLAGTGVRNYRKYLDVGKLTASTLKEFVDWCTYLASYEISLDECTVVQRTSQLSTYVGRYSDRWWVIKYNCGQNMYSLWNEGKNKKLKNLETIPLYELPEKVQAISGKVLSFRLGKLEN